MSECGCGNNCEICQECTLPMCDCVCGFIDFDEEAELDDEYH